MTVLPAFVAAGAVVIVKENAPLAVCESPDDTWRVAELTPGRVTVPVITPSLVNARPPGKAPLKRVHE